MAVQSIQSLQDTDVYRSKQKQAGVSLSTTPKGKLGGSLSMQNISMNSDYASVKTQAGIYGGEGGYVVHTKGTTSLEGAVIASTDDGTKSELQTSDLVTRDIQNKASYTSKGKGISFVKKEDAKFNEKGLTPNVPMSSTKETSSVTTSAIGNGAILIENQAIDIEALNRDVVNTLNSLDTIFDKKKVQERQELAKLFAKNAFEQIHYWEPKTQEEKTAKAAVHGIIAEISSRIAGNPRGSGFYAGMTNKMLLDEAMKLTKGEPDQIQWVSAALGAVVNASIDKGVNLGANVAQLGAKYNALREGVYNSGDEALAMAEADIEDERKLSRQGDMTLEELTEYQPYSAYELAALGSELTNEYAPEYYVASALFRHSMNGGGEKQYFDVNTAAANLLKSDLGFVKAIREASKDMSYGESKSVYASAKMFSRPANYAFGHVKLAVTLHKLPNGRIEVTGLAKDLYNFEPHKYNGSIIPAINNMAYTLQRAGYIHPFVYAIQIKTTV